MNPIGAPGGADTSVQSEAERLRKATSQFEGVFMQYLFAAMRETVPEGGLLDGGSAESIFAGMLDQHLADVAAAGQEDGLGAALYRQLSARLNTPPADGVSQ